MNYRIGRLVLSSLCVGAFAAADIWWCSFCRLQPAKRTPPSGLQDLTQCGLLEMCAAVVVSWQARSRGREEEIRNLRIVIFRNIPIRTLASLCLFVCLSVYLSVCLSLSDQWSAWNNSTPIGQIFMKLPIWVWCIFVHASLYTRREENQLDATESFIAPIICSTCFGHLYEGNFPHPGLIACCSAPNSQPPATKALHTIFGNNTI